MSSSGIVSSSVKFVPARDADKQRGLLGFVTCVAGNLVLDGIAVRRTQEGQLTLSFPERRGRGGERYPYIRPLDDDARRAIEREILGAINLDGSRTQ